MGKVVELVSSPISIGVIILFIAVAAIIAYLIVFPRDTHYAVFRPDGSVLWFSRAGVSYDAPPDRFDTNGFGHIEPYFARLLVPSANFKSVLIATPDRNCAFMLMSREGQVSGHLSVEWRQEP